MDSRAERWPLPSGVWLRDTTSRHWAFAATSGGSPASPSIPMADLHRLVGARTTAAPSADAPRYPPEFHFSPDTGEALADVALPESAPWVPPSGTAPVLDAHKPVREPRGLQQVPAGVHLRPAHRNGRPLQATEDAGHTLPLPPPGRYEFCAARFGAQQDVLLAIEPERGGLFAWLPLAQQWLALEPLAASPLADASVPGERWRMELLQHGSATTMYMPTVSGLAVVQADALTLAYAVSYVGGGPALGAPILWSGEVWAPVRSSPGALSLVSASGAAVPVVLPAAITAVPAFARPVCDARQIVWPCEQGQLVVRKGAGGAPEAAWVDWPAGVKPCFEFGCPYLSRSGSFWQIAFADAADSYVFVQMGRPEPEMHRASSPRFCTGAFSYQHGYRIKGDPWLDPEHVDDASSDEVVIPLIESARQAAVLGLVVETTAGVTALLESNERQRTLLQYQADNSPDLRFFTFQVAQPWRTRAFVHEQRLWIYHPDLLLAHGWDLEK